MFSSARQSSTCARVATRIAAKNADHFTGHIAAFGADRAANAEGMEIESGVDFAGFRGVAVGYHRAGAVLAMSIEQGCNQVAVIVQGKWPAVGGEVGGFAGRDIGGSQ